MYIYIYIYIYIFIYLFIYSFMHITLRVHVPKQYVLWAQRSQLGTTLRAKYMLFGYKDP